ncbi:YdcH family protein [Pseudomonas aegrilactucae]|uniref:YdcH family protein n=1 Tax=Pseudomonas aegrilactucae TaxID=2854028 RepID=A0A9Q2XLS3_9PSED|nr:YdcH family protein [Pseudomonas aegrilactucae]MBV6288446.1 YdcH family protein [Pseudomonas aegrilactucae]
MPVKHDLLADLNLTKEAFEAKKKSDSRLSQLHKEYEAIDARVLEAEKGGASDDQVTHLRKERLRIKDKIVQHLQPAH